MLYGPAQRYAIVTGDGTIVDNRLGKYKKTQEVKQTQNGMKTSKNDKKEKEKPRNKK
jgi:hypothetical protein